MAPWTRGRCFTFLLLGWIALALPAATPAQQPRPPKVDVQKLMHHFMLGRYSMPVTCTQADGSLIDLEEAVVFRSAHDKAGFPVLRATFFGIEAPNAVRCYNLVHQHLVDRRGSLFVSFPAIYRPDLGMHDFRRLLLRGPLEFRVVSGLLELREIGAEPGMEAQRVRFDDDGGTLVISEIPDQSDGDKMLTSRAPPADVEPAARRRFALRVDGPDEFTLEGFYLEDQGRR